MHFTVGGALRYYASRACGELLLPGPASAAKKRNIQREFSPYSAHQRNGPCHDAGWLFYPQSRSSKGCTWIGSLAPGLTHRLPQTTVAHFLGFASNMRMRSPPASPAYKSEPILAQTEESLRTVPKRAGRGDCLDQKRSHEKSTSGYRRVPRLPPFVGRVQPALWTRSKLLLLL